MKIAIAQINPTVGDIAGNVQKIIDFGRRAKAQGAELVIFSEMVVCGYPPMDLLLKESFIESSVFEAAARTGTLLEMNGSPRLDLDEHLARAAARVGARLVVASDAHRTEELPQLAYGVSMARRAWLTADQVANTRGAADLMKLVE